MKQTLFVKYVIPFMQWYALMIFLAIVIDYFLHRFHLLSIGRSLGYIGTFFIIFSFIYSLRKRKIIESGSPKKLLLMHEYCMDWLNHVACSCRCSLQCNITLVGYFHVIDCSCQRFGWQIFVATGN